MPKTAASSLPPLPAVTTDGVPLPVDFESALAELEQLVNAMEGGALTLDSSLAAYRRGAELARLCQDKLCAAEQQVKVLEADVLKRFQGPGDDDAGA